MEKILLSSLTSVEYNPRMMSEGAMRRLVASIVEHTSSLEGWDSRQGYRLATTITVNQQGKRIIGGNQRVEALRRLGQNWIHSGDITWVDLPPSSALEKALNISLNNDFAAGKWRNVGELLSELRNMDIALFERLEISDILLQGAENAGALDPRGDGRVPSGRGDIEDVDDGQMIICPECGFQWRD